MFKIISPKLILISIFIVYSFLISGCSDEAMTDDTVRYALESEPSTLDPAKSTALAESNVELALFEGLTRLDEHEQPQPAAAKSWDISPDGTEYTFHLRDNLLWNMVHLLQPMILNMHGNVYLTLKQLLKMLI